MRSETFVVATQYRLQKWAAQIKDCQSRPEGTKISDWCEAIHSQSIARHDYSFQRFKQMIIISTPMPLARHDVSVSS